MPAVDIIYKIVVPVISAIIGGGITLLGVIKTINHENAVRKDEHELAKKEKAKPILINDVYTHDSLNRSEANILFTATGQRQSGSHLIGVFKNTDNGIIILHSIKSEDVVYYPANGKWCMIDKNSFLRLEIILADKKEQLKGWILNVSDIYGNPYCYTMEYNTADIKASQILLTGMYEPSEKHDQPNG